MESYLSHALDIVTAQARSRTMTETEISEMVAKLSASIKDLALSGTASFTDATPLVVPEAKKAIRERSITCLESGQSFKILTKRHLAKYGLTPEQYREKWGYPKGLPLVCKALQRERRKKMREMKLWERRTKD